MTPQRSNLSEFVSRLAAYMLPVVYFLVTVSFYLKTYDSAQIKITLTQIGCSLIAVLWIIQLLLEKRLPFRGGDMSLAAPFLAVLASGLLSWSHSRFLGGSFDEGLRRVLYCFMGFVALSEFRGMDRQQRLFRWLVAAFGVVVAYAFLQYLDTRLFPPGPPEMGIDPFVWRQAFGARVFSTFGNPNFYGNFLVIITPILLTVFLKDGGQVFRPYLLLPVLAAVAVVADKLWLNLFGGVAGDQRLWFSVLLAVLALGAAALVFWRTPTGASAGMLLFFGIMFVTLYATETKGAWVGFVGAIVGTSVLTGLYLTSEGGRKLTRKILLAAGITAVAGMSVVGYYAYNRMQSVSFRVFTWISTWEMVREHPVLGTGIGTFKLAYPAYRRPEIILLEGKSNTETDHAEDEYLETWYDEGIAGFGIYLWLIFTVSLMGLKTLRRLTAAGPPQGAERERVYLLVAYLGAWWGALLHWFMDVSVRFVSSGIYSLLLPALVAGLSRPEPVLPVQEAPSQTDRRVRAAAAVFWTVVFLVLPRYYGGLPALPALPQALAVFLTGMFGVGPVSLALQAIPALFMGALLWAIGEVLEIRLIPIDAAPAPRPAGRASPAAVLLGAVLLLAWGRWAFPTFRAFFQADIDHNVGIFFSKSGIWSKGPDFDAAAGNLPPDMREEYQRTGGALEHYKRVGRLNPNFPMAPYFVGNVYNDWGSGFYSRSAEARAQGRTGEAERLLAETNEVWDQAEKAYIQLKKFAPNYVQTHHQMGTLYLKRMEMDNALGKPDKAREDGVTALRHFELYRFLDPVYPPNFYRMAQIHSWMGDWDAAEEDYRGALKYNTANVVQRINPDRNVESYTNLGRLLLARLDRANPRGPLNAADPLFAKAAAAFESALGCFRDLGERPEFLRFALDAHKGLGVLYLRAGDRARASEHWGAVAAINPQDADLRRVTGR